MVINEGSLNVDLTIRNGATSLIFQKYSTLRQTAKYTFYFEEWN